MNNIDDIRYNNKNVPVEELEHLEICQFYPYPKDISKVIEDTPIKYGVNLFPLFNVVNIETTSWCNYDCWFCPSKILNREKKEMEPELFKKIILDLKQMDYTGEIRLHQSNEPMTDPHIEDKVLFVKTELPKCTLGFTTNFSLMSYDRLQKLLNAGINFLSVEAYKSETQFNNYLNMLHRLKDNNLDKKIIINAQAVDGKYSFAKEKTQYKNGRLYVTLSRRYPKKGEEKFTDYNNNSITSRLGLIKSKRKCTSNYCTRPFRQLQINYNGYVPLCCEEWIYTPEAMMGDLNKNTISEIWNGKRFFKYRETLQGSYPKRIMKPCNECNFGGGTWPNRIRRVDYSGKTELIEKEKTKQLF